ncbi:unnamed protein product, partial [Staurois parvus]
INSLPAPCLCALPGSAQHRNLVPAVSSGHSGTPIVVWDLAQVGQSVITSLLTKCERSHGTRLLTTALYHVTSCEQSRLTQ